MGIFQTNSEGRIISANSAFARILGYESPEEVVDTVTDIAGQVYVNPEQRTELLQLMNEYGTFQEREIQFFGKDRSVVWVTINGRVMRDGSGKVIFYNGAILDTLSVSPLSAAPPGTENGGNRHACRRYCS